jgi:hypothetical protein
MYTGFIDDSDSTGGNLSDPNAPFQVIGGPIIKDSKYPALELFLSKEISKVVPMEQWGQFEFHCSDLFNARPPFDSFGLEKCRELIGDALGHLVRLEIPIIYGAIDKRGLRKKLFHTANPIDMAFGLYLNCLRKWFAKQWEEGLRDKPMDQDGPLGLLIGDDSREPKSDDKKGEDKRKDVRYFIKNAFRQNRSRVRDGMNVGLSTFLYEDFAFDDSKNSIGLQLADICVYMIAGHLAKRADVEPFYDVIHNQIAPHSERISAPDDLALMPACAHMDV